MSNDLIETITYHGLHLSIARNAGNRICYVLLPEGLQEDVTKVVEEYAEKFGCNIALITGMDWNRDMTPWPAQGVFKKEKPFEGMAEDFLELLIGDILPYAEDSLDLCRPGRYLTGISLSGLFAVWTLFRTDAFMAVASISGSLWYDGFTEWANQQPIVNTAAKVHLSLGNKEKYSKNPRMAVVEDATGQVAGRLEAAGCDVDFQTVPGTHFSPIVPRLELALSAIL